MFKVTCIVGSSHSNGSCAYLVDTLIKGINNPAVEIKKYCVSDINLNYCYGCKKCYHNGECVQDDEVKQTDTLNDLLEKHQTEISKFLELGKCIGGTV